jgi:hypothetical protein
MLLKLSVSARFRSEVLIRSGKMSNVSLTKHAAKLHNNLQILVKEMLKSHNFPKSKESVLQKFPYSKENVSPRGQI